MIMKLYAALVPILLAAPLLAQPDGTDPSLKITGVRFWSLDDGVTRIAIEASGDFEFHADRLQNPERIFFDIPAAQLATGSRRVNVIPVGDANLKQIRMAQTQRVTARVVLDLERPSEFVTSRLSNPDRLIIELRPVASAPGAPDRPVFMPPASKPVEGQKAAQTMVLDPPPTLALTMPPPVPEPTKTDPVPALVSKVMKDLGRDKSTPSVETALPAKRMSEGDRSLTRVLGLKIGRVVIDAGHGGHDAGTTGPSGLIEKDLVLDVSRRLAVLVHDRLGSEVILTRSDDTFVPLEERTRIANDSRADLFLSIHANSSETSSADGIETYYLNFTTSKAALELATRENATSQKTVYELSDLLEKIALKDKIDESREFAARVQTALLAGSSRGNTARLRDRGVRKAPFIVLIGANMPSVLAEIGFISNPHEESLMKRPDYRQRIAESLYKGVAKYAFTLSHFQVALRRNPAE